MWALTPNFLSHSILSSLSLSKPIKALFSQNVRNSMAMSNCLMPAWKARWFSTNLTCWYQLWKPVVVPWTPIYSGQIYISQTSILAGIVCATYYPPLLPFQISCLLLNVWEIGWGLSAMIQQDAANDVCGNEPLPISLYVRVIGMYYVNFGRWSKMWSRVSSILFRGNRSTPLEK